MKSLFDAFESYLQGMVNTSIAGVLSRLDALEKKSSADGVELNEVKDLIATAFQDFDVLEALGNNHRLQEFLETNLEMDDYVRTDSFDPDDYVTKDDLREKVEDVIDNLTFEVTLR